MRIYLEVLGKNAHSNFFNIERFLRLIACLLTPDFSAISAMLIPYFTGYVGEYYPDDFCSVRYYLKNKTEAQVNFVMIAYYNPNETYEVHDEYSYDDMNKVEYEMQLVKVGYVWRVNKYHSPELG